MNPRVLLPLIIAFLIGVRPAVKADPVMDRVNAALTPIMDKLTPKAGVGSNSQTLMISYQAQPFKIPDRSMSGTVSGKVHDEIGPGPRGFVLRVDLQDLAQINQAVTPQTLQEAFWKTDLDVFPVAGGKKQIFWALSYGKETDPKLLGQIKAALKETAGALK